MANQTDSPASSEARNKLCQNYWDPVYAFVRRRGYDHHQAQDLTQGLFLRLFEKDAFQAADRERGRFRTFLLACAQHYLLHQYHHDHAIKRGGRVDFVSFDETAAENRYAVESAQGLSPEKLFDRRWALTVLEQALASLKEEYVAAGKPEEFEVLQSFLSGAKQGTKSYKESGARFGWNEAAVRQNVHRIRRRYAELVRTQVAQTVADPSEFEAEMNHLRAVLSA